MIRSNSLHSQPEGNATSLPPLSPAGGFSIVQRSSSRSNSVAASGQATGSTGGLTPEAKMAMQDILRELELTRKEFAKASVQLTHQETVIAHLKDEEVKKDAIIAHLEDELKNMDMFHQQELAIRSEEAKSRDLELEHKNRYLELEVARLTEENNIYSRYETENAEIRQKVISLQEQVDQLQRLNDELRNRATDDMSEFRGQLEEEFKRRLLESEKRFQEEAYHALNEEAKIALQGNDHLQTMLQKQNDAIEVVLQRCKQLESAHSRMRMEQELSQQSVVYQQNEMVKVRKHLTQSKSRCEELENSLKQRRIERASLELLYMEYESTRKDLTSSTDKLRRTQRSLDRWKSRAMGLAKETLLLRQQLSQAQSSSTAVPSSPKQKGILQDQKRKILNSSITFQPNLSDINRAKLHSSGSTSSGGSSSSGSSSEEEEYGADWEATVDNTSVTKVTITGGTKGGRHIYATPDSTAAEGLITVAPQKVDPISVLSMWNVNYETWRSPYDTAVEFNDAPAGENAIDFKQPGDGTSSFERNTHVTAAHESDRKEMENSREQSEKLSKKEEGIIQMGIKNVGGLKSTPVPRRRGQVEEVRLQKDRELSVLSKRRIKFMPPQRGQITVVRTSTFQNEGKNNIQASGGNSTSSSGLSAKNFYASVNTSTSTTEVADNADSANRKAQKTSFLQTEMFFGTKSPALHKNRFLVP